MSADTPSERDRPPLTHITLERSEDGEVWIAIDEETGVATEGGTRQHALEMLDDAVAAYHGTAGRPPTDDELRDLGIGPEANTNGELSDILT